MQGLRYQQMRVGKHGAESSVENALSECPQFGLKEHEAKVIVKEISQIIDQWRKHFEILGVDALTIAQVGRFLDSEYLLGLRASV
jgi:serine/threonine-protein kinase HipA